MSGWMGTLNDWFTNEGFTAYTVANGKLVSGDEIRMQYTMDWGADLGSDWSGTDTSLKAISSDYGTLSPNSVQRPIIILLLFLSAQRASISVLPH